MTVMGDLRSGDVLHQTVKPHISYVVISDPRDIDGTTMIGTLCLGCSVMPTLSGRSHLTKFPLRDLEGLGFVVVRRNAR